MSTIHRRHFEFVPARFLSPIAWLLLTLLILPSPLVQAEPPTVGYIFPAGGQRGTTVEFKVGGHFLYDGCPFSMRGPGVEASTRIEPTKTVWFEGPLIPLPASQQKEDYARDYAGQVKIAADAPLGLRYWHVSTSQGVTPSMKFVVGDLPEVVEEEIDGRPIPVHVALPATINGRIFPREDVDIWTFDATAGQLITCEVYAARLGSGLDSRLEIRDPSGTRIAENVDTFGSDSFVRFKAAADGTYQVHIHDVNFGGLQHYVYRLTVTAGPYVDFVYPLGGRRGSTVNFELAGAHVPGEPVAIALPAESESDDFIYRFAAGDAPGAGSVSNGIALELSDLPEFLEREPNDGPAAAVEFTVPAVLNGRIGRPGDVDMWTFEAKQGDECRLDLRASRLGSPLDSVLTVLDSTGKQIATADDIGKGQTDSQLSVKIPADGRYSVRVEERIASRGGERFAYRLYVAGTLRVPSANEGERRSNDAAVGTRSVPATVGDFRLLLPSDAVTLERGGKQVAVKLEVERRGFQDEIELEFEDLPEGVTFGGAKIAKGSSNAQITLKAEGSAKLQIARCVLRGKAVVGEETIVRRAFVPAAPGEPVLDEILLAVVPATPFKFYGEFDTKFASRGTVFVRHYKLQRNGFAGPIEISLADRQGRHLQGVTGPKIVLPPETTEFDYPITLPPGMEIGRTSRTCLMAVGVIEEPDGSHHTVSYSSNEQNDQVIVLVDPGKLSVDVFRESLVAMPGERVRVPMRIGRGSGVEGAVVVELALPEHIGGVAAEPIIIGADQRAAELEVRFGADRLGPFNMPLTLRAHLMDERGYPVVAEAELVVVPAEPD